MLGSLNALFASTVLLVVGHFALSSMPVRMKLVGWLGETRYLVAYSALMLAAMIWMVMAYIRAPADPVWTTPGGLIWLPVILMPLAIFLIVAGLTTPSPTLAGTKLDDHNRDLTSGIVRVTRHPFLNGVSLWALVHLLVNGGHPLDRAVCGHVHSVGRRHVAHRQAARVSLRRRLGPVMLTTSAVPFVALIEKRATMDWAGIGWWRVLLSVAVYLALIAAHGFVIGRPAWPGIG